MSYLHAPSSASKGIATASSASGSATVQAAAPARTSKRAAPLAPGAHAAEPAATSTSSTTAPGELYSKRRRETPTVAMHGGAAVDDEGFDASCASDTDSDVSDFGATHFGEPKRSSRTPDVQAAAPASIGASAAIAAPQADAPAVPALDRHEEAMREPLRESADDANCQPHLAQGEPPRDPAEKPRLIHEGGGRYYDEKLPDVHPTLMNPDQRGANFYVKASTSREAVNALVAALASRGPLPRYRLAWNESGEGGSVAADAVEDERRHALWDRAERDFQKAPVYERLLSALLQAVESMADRRLSRFSTGALRTPAPFKAVATAPLEGEAERAAFLRSLSSSDRARRDDLAPPPTHKSTSAEAWRREAIYIIVCLYKTADELDVTWTPAGRGLMSQVYASALTLTDTVCEVERFVVNCVSFMDDLVTVLSRGRLEDDESWIKIGPFYRTLWTFTCMARDVAHNWRTLTWWHVRFSFRWLDLTPLELAVDKGRQKISEAKELAKKKQAERDEEAAKEAAQPEGAAEASASKRARRA